MYMCVLLLVVDNIDLYESMMPRRVISCLLWFSDYFNGRYSRQNKNKTLIDSGVIQEERCYIE